VSDASTKSAALALTEKDTQAVAEDDKYDDKSLVEMQSVSLQSLYWHLPFSYSGRRIIICTYCETLCISPSLFLFFFPFFFFFSVLWLGHGGC
jgi:hypothetical protein